MLRQSPRLASEIAVCPPSQPNFFQLAVNPSACSPAHAAVATRLVAIGDERNQWKAREIPGMGLLATPSYLEGSIHLTTPFESSHPRALDTAWLLLRCPFIYLYGALDIDT